MPLLSEIESIISQLITTHGEEGVCPTREDWRAIFEIAGPIRILNLLKFKPEVSGEDGKISGGEAYGLYAQGVAPVFQRVGGQRIFAGRVGASFAMGPKGDWDFAIVTRYPSPQALAAMWLDEEFIKAHENRLDGVAASQVYVFGGQA
jgi:uncharacterized protein (DUF1330 family)